MGYVFIESLIEKIEIKSQNNNVSTNNKFSSIEDSKKNVDKFIGRIEKLYKTTPLYSDKFRAAYFDKDNVKVIEQTTSFSRNKILFLGLVFGIVISIGYIIISDYFKMLIKLFAKRIKN